MGKAEKTEHWVKQGAVARTEEKAEVTGSKVTAREVPRRVAMEARLGVTTASDGVVEVERSDIFGVICEMMIWREGNFLLLRLIFISAFVDKIFFL